MVFKTPAPTTNEEQSPYTITSEILQERLSHENRGRFITQACIVLIAGVAALSFGTVLGWSSPAARQVMLLGNYTTSYNLTEGQLSWVASLMPLGCSFGTTLWTYSTIHMGPKHTMVIQTPFYVFSFLMTLTVRRLEIFLAGRFFSGFMSIAFIIGGECLLVDCVHPGYLRNMIVFFNSSITLGILLSYLIGHFLSYKWLTILLTVIPTMNTLCLLFLPESPVYLFDKNELKAERSLAWYRGRENIYTELRFIKKDSELRKICAQSDKYMFYAKVVLKGFLIVLGLTSFQAFSGYYAFIFYSPSSSTKPIFSKLTDGVIFYSVVCVCKFLSSIVHFRVPFGVRKPLLVSCSMIALTFTILTIYLWAIKSLHEPPNVYWLPLLLLSIFVISYEIGLGTYGEILLIDYLPYQVYPRAKTLIRASYWFEIFLLTKFFKTITYHTSTFVTFGILTFISYLSIVYCIVFIIESKGKNLLHIQLELGGDPIGNRAAYRYRQVARNTSIM